MFIIFLGLFTILQKKIRIVSLDVYGVTLSTLDTNFSFTELPKTLQFYPRESKVSKQVDRIVLFQEKLYSNEGYKIRKWNLTGTASIQHSTPSSAQSTAQGHFEKFCKYMFVYV